MQNIPTITKNLLLINVAAFLLTMFMPSLQSVMGLHYFQASEFHIYQLITYMFMHGGWTHLFFNMFALWMFGVVMEQTWGARKFLTYYLVCGVGAGLMQEIAQFVQFYAEMSSQGMTFDMVLNISKYFPAAPMQLNAWTTVGASGCVYGILLAFGMTYPENRMFIFPLPVPIKAKWFVIGYAAIELFSALSQANDGVAHVAHLGGMLFGFILIRHWRNKARANSSNFRGWDNYSSTSTYNSGSYYDRGSGSSILGKIRNWYENYINKSQQSQSSGGTTNRHQSDWDYNERHRKEDEEIDRILDKIRRCGYDGLTSEEKRKLFDASKK